MTRRPPSSKQGIDTTFINWRGFFAPPGTSDEKTAQYIAALEALYETEAWEEVRARNGWVNIWNPGEDFRTFLEAQETGNRRPDAAARLPLRSCREGRRDRSRPASEIRAGRGSPRRPIASTAPIKGRGRHGAGSLDRADLHHVLLRLRLSGLLHDGPASAALSCSATPVWPSTFPKVLSVLGIIVGLVVLFGLESHSAEKEPSATDIKLSALA